jgi:anti-sigma regulatory factor (Ser/Thr protein kinase)
MDTLTRPPGTGIYSVELDATLEAPGESRRYVEGVLAVWVVPADLIDMTQLLTSELVTNAVTHGEGQGGKVTLEIRSFGCCLGVDVSDGSLGSPVVCSPADDTEHGRGLLLVARIADSWGYYFDTGRKHVWFHLRMTGPTPPPEVAAVMPAA